MTAKSDDELVDWIKLWAGDRLRGWRSREPGYMQYRRRLVETALIPKAEIAQAMMAIACLKLPTAEARKRVFDALTTVVHRENRQPTYHYNDERGGVLADMAEKGDADANAAMSRITSELLPKMPARLARHNQAILQKEFDTPPKRRKGGDRHAKTARNLFIIDAVSALHRGGIHPTQNRASRDRGKSGCAIVAKALAGIGIHIDATGVEKVWAGRSRYVRR